MKHHQAVRSAVHRPSVTRLLLPALLAAALVPTPGAQAIPVPSLEVASLALLPSLTTVTLNAALTTYAYRDLAPAEAGARNRTLEQYLGELGLRHLWQMHDAGVTTDVWYSPDADLSVLRQVEGGDTLSMTAYALPGRVRRGEILGTP